MRHARLYDAQYTCLSYTWQTSYPQHVIEVSGRSLSVGENLYQFLHAYRRSQSLGQLGAGIVKHSLWIDAVCIQKDDTKKKNH
jgi:hypothetical protein